LPSGGGRQNWQNWEFITVGRIVAPPCIFFRRIHPDPHAHIGSRAIHGPEGGVTDEKSESSKQAGIEDLEALRNQKDLDDSAIAQIIGVAVLEFGVLLHRCFLQRLIMYNS
jgi:hypothetical protein